jgi:hypothetical protein
MQNFRTLGQPLLGEKKPQETHRRLWDEDSVSYERRGKTPSLVATMFCLQCLRAPQALRMDINIQTAPPSWMWGKTFIIHIKFVLQTIKLWWLGLSDNFFLLTPFFLFYRKYIKEEMVYTIMLLVKRKRQIQKKEKSSIVGIKEIGIKGKIR